MLYNFEIYNTCNRHTHTENIMKVEELEFPNLCIESTSSIRQC